MIAGLIVMIIFVACLWGAARLMADDYVNRTSHVSIRSRATGPSPDGRGNLMESYVHDFSYSPGPRGVYGPFPLSGRASREKPETFRKHVYTRL